MNEKFNFKIICINLKRRGDRKEQMIQLFQENNIKEDLYDFFEAIDGKELQATEELKTIFKKNNFNSRRGVIGCALSHKKIWEQLQSDEKNDIYLILEDDIKFIKNFSEGFKNLINKLSHNYPISEWDIIYLGYSMLDIQHKKKYKTFPNSYNLSPNIQKFDNENYMGGTFSYFINKKCALKFLNIIKEKGIQDPIDCFMKEYGKKYDLKNFETQPCFIFSRWMSCYYNNSIDTDIQRDFSQINLN